MQTNTEPHRLPTLIWLLMLGHSDDLLRGQPTCGRLKSASTWMGLPQVAAPMDVVQAPKAGQGEAALSRASSSHPMSALYEEGDEQEEAVAEQAAMFRGCIWLGGFDLGEQTFPSLFCCDQCFFTQ